MWHTSCLVFVLIAVCVAATHAAADVLVLEDGRVLEGVTVEETERGVEIAFPHGRVVVEKASVHAMYPDEDPAGAAVLREIRDHAKWRNRWKHEGTRFRYETTVPPIVFERYRKELEDHFDLLRRVLALPDAAAPPALVCLYSSQKTLQRMGGVGGGVTGYFRHQEPLELHLFDERVNRVAYLQTARWLAAAYAVRRAWPKLPRGTFLRQALTHYFGSLATDESPPGGVRAEAPGELWQALVRGPVRTRLSANLAHVLYERAAVREAWGWALVHFLLSSDDHAAAFREYVDTAPALKDQAELDALATALGVGEPEARERFCEAWEAHLGTIRPSTGVAWVRAGEEALRADDLRRAEAYYEKAAAFPEARRAALAGLARVRKARGQREAEVEALRVVLAEDPLDVEARRRLATCLEATGPKEDAAREAALAGEIDSALRGP